MTQRTIINLHPYEFNQGLRYCPYAVNLDKCTASCNTLDYLSNRICFLNKTKDVNLIVFNIIAGINE